MEEKAEAREGGREKVGLDQGGLILERYQRLERFSVLQEMLKREEV